MCLTQGRLSYETTVLMIQHYSYMGLFFRVGNDQLNYSYSYSFSYYFPRRPIRMRLQL